MKALDRLTQRMRIDKAAPYIPQGGRVLDIGCADGILFRHFGDRIGEGVGIDLDIDEAVQHEHYRLIPGWFPEDLDDDRPFDTITMTAVLEHIPRDRQTGVAEGCAQYLKPGGHLVITTPHPFVDVILHVLLFLRLIDGMSLEQHYGFSPPETRTIFESAGLSLVEQSRFELGLNYLFVFQKPPSA